MHTIKITNKYTNKSYMYPIIYDSIDEAEKAIKDSVPQRLSSGSILEVCRLVSLKLERV